MGEILENQSIRDDALAWLKDMLYLDSDEEQRGQIRAIRSDDDKLWHLYMLIGQLRQNIKEEGDAPVLEMALAALSIEDMRFDRRDSVMVLKGLCRTAANAGIRVKDILPKFAKISSPAVRGL